MYIRLTFLNFLPGKAGEASEIYNSQVAPSIRRQDGILDVMLLEPEDASGEYISCTMWESKEHAEAYQSGNDYKTDFVKIKELASKPPVVKYFLAS